MTDIKSTTSKSQFIAANQLEKSPLNARRTGAKTGIDEMKASILAHGLMHNLVVTDAGGGNYLVIAGGRRLEAIHSLQAEGKLPQDFAVPCQIVSENHALEMSLAENTVRLAMHPADQFEAFAALIEQGESAADVARRFGVEESVVLKRMRLARVAPELLREYREEGMTLECLMAFTVTDDRRQQLKVFKSLESWQKEDPKAIRAALTGKMMQASNKLARFVGLDAYQSAGGAVRNDLFGSEVYLETPSLVQRLAKEKLGVIRKELDAEGWSWIEISDDRDGDAVYRCARIQPRLIGAPPELLKLKSQLDEELSVIERDLDDNESDALLKKQRDIHDRLQSVEEKLAAFVDFDDVLKRLAGCWVSIGHDGKAFVDKGLVKPENRKLVAKLLGDESDPAASKAKPKHALSETLRRDLAAARLQVAQAEIAKRPDIALDLLTFQAARALIERRHVSDGADIVFLRAPLKLDAPENTTTGAALAAISKALPAGWLKAKSEAASFDAFRSLPEARKREWLAYCVALTLQPKLGASEGDNATAYDAALSLTGACVADYWRPAKDNFLERISRAQLLAIGREVLGEQWAQSRVSDKKAGLVEQLDRAFLQPEKSGRTAEQVAKLKRWLPEGMSFDIGAPSKPAKRKKLIKAA